MLVRSCIVRPGCRDATPTHAMTRENWRHVEPILTRALELPESERDALLASAEIKDVLRREIVDLLGSSATRTGPPPPTTLIALTSGDTLDNGRFVIVRQIGRGGMGDVYLAQDTVLGTLVALKVVAPDERLIREAQRSAVCSGHEHVAGVHNVFRTEHRGEAIGVLVMEHVAGRAASRILEDGPVDIDRALRWMQQVASAVAHAHDCEVLHCDLKPANFLVTADDRVKVLDFGIARASFDARNRNEPAYGTLPYMAPEQLSSGEFSRASDVYSLGVTLFELVTGRRPFEGDEPMVRIQILRVPPPKASEFVPEIPVALDEIIDRALAKNPDERFRSARAFARALERLKSTSTQTDIRPAPPAPPPPPSPPVWKIVAAIVAIILAMSLMLGFIACRMFEVVLRIDSEFATPLPGYFRVGREALLPFVAVSIVAALPTAMVAAIVILVRRLANRQWQQFRRWLNRFDPNVLAGLTLLAGAMAWLILTWQYRDLFVALFELHQTPATASVTAISNAARDQHIRYANASASLSLFLVVAALVWLPYLRRRSTEPATVRLMTSAMLVLAIVVMLGPSVPRRFLFEYFRVVEYAGQSTLEIGGTDDNILLYDSSRRVTLRVRRDAPSLNTTESRRQIFAN